MKTKELLRPKNPIHSMQWWLSLGYSKKEAMALVLLHYRIGVRFLAKYGSSNVRKEIALAGYCHDILYKDKLAKVRIAVAAHGNYLFELVHDPNTMVRRQVELYRESIARNAESTPPTTYYVDDISEVLW